MGVSNLDNFISIKLSLVLSLHSSKYLNIPPFCVQILSNPITSPGFLSILEFSVLHSLSGVGVNIPS